MKGHVAAMETKDKAAAATPIEIAAEPADSADAVRCINAYFHELQQRFEHGFDPGSGGYAVKKTDGKGCFLIARRNGEAVGCGELRALDAETGEIKRMWVAPQARGMKLQRLDLKCAQLFIEARTPDEVDAVARLQYGLHAPRASTAHEAEMPAMGARHHLKNGAGFAMFPRAEDRKSVV